MRVEEQEKLPWLDRLDYCLSDYDRIDIEIERAREDFESFLHVKEREKSELESKYEFVKGILNAGGETKDDKTGDLSTHVTTALAFLGFKICPIEDPVRSTRKHDARWVQDGDYLALIDVTATIDANVTVRDYNRLLGRIALILRRPEVAPGRVAPAGLLVANHDRMTNPFDRPKLYESDKELLTDAVDQRLGLLSTVELYKLVLAVEEQKLSKDDARKLIKQPGRIEFDWREHQERIPARPKYIVLDGKVLAVEL